MSEYMLCSINQTEYIAVLTKCMEQIDKVPSPPARIMREGSSIWEYIMAVVACAVFPAAVVNPFSPVVDILILGWRI